MKCRIQCIMALLMVVLAHPIMGSQGYRDFKPLVLDTRDTELFSVEGYVFDEFNGRTIGFAEVKLSGIGGFVEIDSTDTSGFFRFAGLDPSNFPYHQSTLTVKHLGYRDSEPMELLEGVCPTIFLRSRTVILLHGIKGSYEGTWGGDNGAFIDSLTHDDRGFRVVGVDMGGFPDNVRPISFAEGRFREILDNNCHQLGIQSYDMIAHSMGGLVGRSFATKSYGRDRINKLVTLGTPHHGAYIANVLSLPEQAGQDYAFLTAEFFCWVSDDLICPDPADLPAITALQDLRIGSQFLNSLNFGQDHTSIFFNPCRSTFNETTNHYSTTIYSIAGTEPGGRRLFAVPFLGCQVTIRWSIPPITDWATSDAVVLKPRAFFHNGFNCTDIGLGCSGVHHKLFSEPMTKSSCLAGKVAELLKNGTFDCNSTEFTKEEEGFIPSSLPRVTATIQPGTTYEDSTLINAMTLVDFLCVSSADSLVYTLESPTGRIVDPAECELDPDLDFIREAQSAFYSIRNPESGLWRHFVTCIDSTEPEYTMIFTTFDGEVVLAAETTTGIDPDGAFTLYASFTDAGYSIPAGVVTATVTRPDDTTDQIELFDDGFVDDEIAGDGIFTGTYPAADEVGTFGFVFLGETDPGNPESEVREALHVATAAWLSDPAIVEPGLEVSETELAFGGLLDLSASFTNLGTATADSVWITISNVTLGVTLADTLVEGMTPGQTITLQAEWLAVAGGEFALRAGIDLIGEQIESNLSDNGAEVVVTVSLPDDVTGVPDGGVSDDPDSDPAGGNTRILLYPSFPNPLAAGSASIRFQVPQVGAKTDLAIFDIRGRRIKTLVSEFLPQGEHARAWNGSDHLGRQVASGIYFYRLQVAGEVQIKKMVVIR